MPSAVHVNSDEFGFNDSHFNSGVKRQHIIDYIVKDRITPTVQDSVPLFNNQSINNQSKCTHHSSESPQNQKMSTEEFAKGDAAVLQNKKSGNLKQCSIISKEEKDFNEIDRAKLCEMETGFINGCDTFEFHAKQDTERVQGDNYFGSMYRYPDLSSEVKHARTPLNTTSQETHSPQLPVPSPNYPVQTQLPVEVTVSCSNAIGKCYSADSKQPSSTFVPTINNNYIIAPHAASQSEEKESSANCHLTHSNRPVNEHTSDLKQSEHLSNLELSESKMRSLYGTLSNRHTLNKVNLSKIECDTREIVNCLSFKSTCDTLNPNNDGKSPETVPRNCNVENSFTVLNIPNLNFQAPPTKKQKLSKIDLATLKRKMRRKKLISKTSKTVKNKVHKSLRSLNNPTTDFGVQICGYSDSSSSSIYSSSDCESDYSGTDLWIRSGPPSKLDLKPEKLKFLKILGLTTHREENCKY